MFANVLNMVCSHPKIATNIDNKQNYNKMKKVKLPNWLYTIFGVIGRFLYNPIYVGRKSLYGAGIFPFWLYIKYFGKPVYKKARKLGANTYFSLMAANILGSLAHVGFFINGTASTILWFISSLILFAGIFFGIHKLNALQQVNKHNSKF